MLDIGAKHKIVLLDKICLTVNKLVLEQNTASILNLLNHFVRSRRKFCLLAQDLFEVFESAFATERPTILMTWRQVDFFLVEILVFTTHVYKNIC